MSNCCNCDSEINLDGSGQLGRYLKALDPSYALIDDRSIEDLLVFTRRYANQVRFYDIPGSNPGQEKDPTKISWTEFFRRDMAVIFASIGTIDLDTLKKNYDAIRTALDVKPGHHLFSNLFDPILGIAVRIDKWYALAIPENPLHDDLLLAINSNLKTQMQKIVAYEEGFKFVDSQHPLKLDYTGISNKALWGLNDPVNADITIYQGTELADRIRYASLYVDDIFNSFYGFLKGLVERSEGYMQYALEQYPAHQPHMALFISFLQLFRLAQDQMNGLTGRMLDFYYRDVLQLTAKPAIPDKAYIVFELAKDVTEFDIAPGTTLKAVPDAAGNDQVYATETDLVVNQAKVTELKTIFIDKQSGITADADATNIINTIYARPIAKSLDGFGAKFTDPNPKWPTFGKGQVAIDINQPACKQIAAPADADRTDQAEIGFAIASPELLLQGGKRLLEITGLGELFTDLNQNDSLLEIWFSGEKGWIKVDQVMSADDLKALQTYGDNGILDPGGKVVKSYHFQNKGLMIYLPGSEKSVIPFDPAIHTGFAFITEYPVLRIMIKPEIEIDQSLFANLKIDNLSLASIVGSINPEFDKVKADTNMDQDFGYHYDGLKTLILQNDLGLIAPPDQPFDPFTPYPAKGKTLYIGSDELFNKNLMALAVNIKFVSTTDQTPTAFGNSAGTVAARFPLPFAVSLRQDSDWILLARQQAAKPVAGFTQWSLTENILNIIKDPADTATAAYFPKRLSIENVEGSPNSIDKGYIKIENEVPVDPSEGESILQASQDMAQQFQMKEISVSYLSYLPSLDSAVDQFFHIYPFGVVETYINVNDKKYQTEQPPADFNTLDAEKNFLLVDAHNLLLPQFNYVNPYAKYDQAAAVMSSAGGAFGRVRDTLSVAANADTKLISSIMNSGSAAARLMLDASGLVEKTVGSDNQYSVGLPEEGMLFIGVENLQPLQMVSMLFQFAEGSADNEDDDPPTINWSYLTYNEWRPLKAENIVSDSTYGFQTTGIVKIDTPEDASSHNTIITDGLIWFCASVSENANRIPQLIDVVTQAIEAQFQDNMNDPSHYDNALPAASISQLVNPVAQIASVNQPFQSFDGKHEEVGKEFYTRVSERLRHKGRAITAWDYEHLVLDRFPGIYKVKCITHTDPNCNCRTAVNTSAVTNAVSALPVTVLFNGDAATITATLNKVVIEIKNNPSTDITLVAYGDGALDKIKELFAYLTTNNPVSISGVTITNIAQTIPAAKISWRIVSNSNIDSINVDIIKTDSCCGPQIAPGHVLMIPVSNFKNRNSDNPLQPKTGRRTLLAIQDYLSGLTSPFVHVHAKNPEYDEVIVSFKVRFYDGIDKGYYMKKLNDEIVQFLTPWAFDENADVQFDQKIYASSVIDFIEKRPYVDFITEFVMGVCCNTCCPDISTGAFGTVSGTITDEKGQGIAAVLVKIKDLNLSTTTADGTTAAPDNTIPAKGTYSFDAVPNGEHIMVAYFSLFSTVKKIFTTPDAQDVPAVVDITHADQTLNTGCGCEDIEYLLEGDANFQGDIVAKPCTTHSILVSVPHHIIIPYTDPDPVSPCDKPAIESQQGNSIHIADKVTLPAIVPVLKKNIEIPSVVAAPKAVIKEKKVTKTVKKPASVKHPKKKKN